MNKDDFFDSFLNYLETTSDEELLEEWNKYEIFDKIGPKVKDFIHGLIIEQETNE